MCLAHCTTNPVFSAVSSLLGRLWARWKLSYAVYILCRIYFRSHNLSVDLLRRISLMTLCDRFKNCTFCVPNAQSYVSTGIPLKLRSISCNRYGIHGFDGNVFFVIRLKALWLRLTWLKIGVKWKNYFIGAYIDFWKSKTFFLHQELFFPISRNFSS